MGTDHSSLRKRREKCRCIHCTSYFTPDPRNRHHQQYCSKPECRKASKTAAQKRWLSSSKGDKYFIGKKNVEHVQRWRKTHPEYWKKPCTTEPAPLQDLLNSQVVENNEDTENRDLLVSRALQDLCLLQPALIIGLIANLTGSALQDDIAQTVRQFIVFGQDILGTDVKDNHI